MIIFPDSPRFLYNKGKEAQASAALKRLRGPDYSVEPELDEYYADKKKEEQVHTLAARICAWLLLPMGGPCPLARAMKCFNMLTPRDLSSLRRRAPCRSCSRSRRCSRPSTRSRS
jgi:hypothetical protein